MDSAILSNYFEKNWELSLEMMEWDYTEFSDGEKLMNDNGNLKGLGLSYTRPDPNSNWLFKVGYSYVAGSVHYKGQLQNGTPFEMDSKYNIGTLMATLGIVLGTPDFAMIPYAGIGVETINNPEQESVPNDYDREISHTYIPIGVDFNKALGTGHQLKLSLIYNLFLEGTVTTDLPPEIEGEQDQGESFGVGASFIYKLNNLFSLGLSINYEYWKIEDSTTTYLMVEDENGNSGLLGFYEPQNETKILRTSVSILF